MYNLSKITSDYIDFLLIVGFMFLNFFVQLFRIFQLYIKIDFFKQKETPVIAKIVLMSRYLIHESRYRSIISAKVSDHLTFRVFYPS